MSTEKHDLYAELVMQAKSLLESEDDLIANLANLSSLIYWKLPQTNWVGFYLAKQQQLVLGPFHGQPACVRIPWGRGVCGTAAANNEVQRIDDVHQFEGHIACDVNSNSEIVIPVTKDGEVIGVLDIDSPVHNRFDEIDQQYLVEIVKALEAKL